MMIFENLVSLNMKKAVLLITLFLSSQALSGICEIFFEYEISSTKERKKLDPSGAFNTESKEECAKKTLDITEKLYDMKSVKVPNIHMRRYKRGKIHSLRKERKNFDTLFLRFRVFYDENYLTTHFQY